MSHVTSLDVNGHLTDSSKQCMTHLVAAVFTSQRIFFLNAINLCSDITYYVCRDFPRAIVDFVSMLLQTYPIRMCPLCVGV